MSDARTKIIEMLADNEHATWSSWMKYLFVRGKFDDEGNLILVEEDIGRWHEQAETLYADLTEEDKEKDRREVCGIADEIHHHPVADHLRPFQKSGYGTVRIIQDHDHHVRSTQVDANM